MSSQENGVCYWLICLFITYGKGSLIDNDNTDDDNDDYDDDDDDDDDYVRFLYTI